MTEYINLAEFSKEGLNIGKDQKVLSYLHGLSDFWVYMFEDASKVNLALESNAIQASDIYNKFLQLTSIINLEDISTLTNSQLKLIILPSDSTVPNSIETYYLPTTSPIKNAKCIANRPLLPTVLLEDQADFFIDPDLGTISFSRSLNGLGFPFRINSTTGAKEFALWFVDARVDDQLIYKHYAKLINIDPASSSSNFRNFVYGLYYLYVNGPNISTLRKGLNITLGIPLARDTEEVLEIRKYLNTDQYLVITDINSYIIPYGLEPTVAVGDILNTGDEIAVWVEVKDYTQDGDWWINFMIPHHILPNVPTDVPLRNRYATAGSYADYLMSNYLKKHTFLVNIKTVSFKNIQSFEQLSSIIKEVKPSHTTPIYVWTVPVPEELLVVTDDTLDISKIVSRCESLTDGIYSHERDSLTPLPRGCPHLTRMSVTMELDYMTGYSSEINGTPRSFNTGVVNGFIFPQRAYRELTAKEEAWERALRSRNQDQYRGRRGLIDRNRSHASSGNGKGINPFTKDLFPGYRMVYLYTTTLEDAKLKFSFVGSTMPSDYLSTLFRPIFSTNLLNSHAINGAIEINYKTLITNNFDFFFKKTSSVGFLGPFFPKDSYKNFTPDPLDLTDDDFLAFTRIEDYGVGVFWITKNFQLETPAYWSREGVDPLQIKISGKMTRGMAPLGSPYYQLRAADVNIGYARSNTLNEKEIDGDLTSSTTLEVSYEDTLNPRFSADRSGRTLITSRTLR